MLNAFLPLLSNTTKGVGCYIVSFKKVASPALSVELNLVLLKDGAVACSNTDHFLFRRSFAFLFCRIS